MKFVHEYGPGEAFPPLETTVTAEFNQQILFAQEDFDARTADPQGGPAPVHPALLLALSANTRSPGYRLAPGTGAVLAEDEVEFLAPAWVPARLVVAWRVREVYAKRGRTYQAIEGEVRDEAGVTILTRVMHVVLTRRQETP